MTTALKTPLALLALGMLAGLSCSLPAVLGSPLLENPSVVPTFVEQTMEALRLQAQPATPTITLTPTPTLTPTNTPLTVVLTLSSAASCYGGPGSRYGRVTSLAAGNTLTAVGRDSADNYWIVIVPGNAAAVCWVAGQFVQVSGGTASLPEFPTPTLSPYSLSEPKNLRTSCSSAPSGSHAADWTVTLRWTNTEPSQLGVRIFRDGRQIATLGPGARSYLEEFRHRNNAGSVTYGVQAYNATAVSGVVTIELRRCG